MAQKTRRAASLLLACALMWLVSPITSSVTDPIQVYPGLSGDGSGSSPEMQCATGYEDVLQESTEAVQSKATVLSVTPSGGNGKVKSWVATRQGQLDDSTGISRVVLTQQDLETLWKITRECSLDSGYRSALALTISRNSDATASEVELDREYFNKIADLDRMNLFLETQFGKLSLDSQAISSIRLTAGQGNILIRIGEADTSSLPYDLLQSIGSRPAVCFSVGTPEGILETVGGNMSLSLPYQLDDGESEDALVTYELTAGGPVAVNSFYIKAPASVSMNTLKLSSYAVALRPRVFSDVEPTDICYEASAFVHDRGISAGRGDGSFGPDDPLTRGEFVFMLLKAYDIKPRSDEPDNFTDAGGEVYSPYLAAAKRMGVVEGMGDNRFMPEAKLTRQDMCTMLYRALQKLGKLPAQGTFTLSGYSDAEEVQGYAREAMAVLVREGIVSGYEGRLSPLETTTRAHMAQMLYNLLR